MKRLPRFRRNPDQLSSTRITERSHAILDAVERYRVLSTSMIVQLVGGNEDVTHRHLQRLYHLGLLERHVFKLSDEFTYSRTDAAKPNPKSDSNHRQATDTSPGRLLFLQHELMISRFHFMLEKTCDQRQKEISLLNWRQGAELWNSVELEGGKRLPHRPDAFFSLQSAENSERARLNHFLYEADRGTSSLSRMRDKLAAHHSFIVQAKHCGAYKIKRLRAILIEASSVDRAERLREIAYEICRDVELFWFTSSEIFSKQSPTLPGHNSQNFLDSPEIIFAPIWISQIGDNLKPLPFE